MSSSFPYDFITANMSALPPLFLYNSLTRCKQTFTPLATDHVKMYVCGPTVYDRAHLGNARSAVVFDQLYRMLRALFPRVTYARNITDVDDKINTAAHQQSVPIEAITARTTAWYHEDMAALGTLPPDIEPRATHHIGDMITMISTLIQKGHAYAAQGHVLFRVASFPHYGKLSGRNREEMVAGARVEIAPYKEDPADFVLWKPSEDDHPSERQSAQAVGWESPWGFGRPGWHIECSAMGQKHLGFPLDIHAGGHDLTFPHHENEIAQGECATGLPCANYWLHNGMLTVDGQKMSKSLGNFVTVDTVRATISGEVIRYALLSGHYRQNLDWNGALLRQSSQALDRFYQTLGRGAAGEGTCAQADPVLEPSNPVFTALLDDINTPKAFAALHDLCSSLNKTWDSEVFNAFYAGARFLGFLQTSKERWFQGTPMGEKTQGKQPTAAWIESAIDARKTAKQGRDFAQADRIRADLLAQGIALEDHKDGTTSWKRSAP